MKVLVTVASRHGATVEIGEAIAQRLRERALDVVTMAPDRVAELAAYEAVVLGSAVYMSRWLPAAADFAARDWLALRDRRVWLFSSGPLGSPSVPVGDPPEVASLMERVGAREHRTFAGALREAGLGLKERFIVKMVKAPYGDFRDWAAIDAWADEIAHALTPATVS